MKKILMSTLVAASLACVAPAVAAPADIAAPLNLEQMDEVTAGSWSRAPRPTTIRITNQLNSTVKTTVTNDIKLTGSDFKAAARADAFSLTPAFTTAVAVSSGETTRTLFNYSSFAVSESVGAIMPK